MRSKLADEAKRALLEADQRLTAEERLEAFVEHCQLMVELSDAGERLRDPDGPEGKPR